MVWPLWLHLDSGCTASCLSSGPLRQRPELTLTAHMGPCAGPSACCAQSPHCMFWWENSLYVRTRLESHFLRRVRPGVQEELVASSWVFL